MEYDGIVTKILQDDEDYYYLFLVDPVKKVLVDGVNITSGSFSDSFKPAGKFIPQTDCFCLYSFQPDPERYPLTTHSTGKGLVFKTSIDRASKSSLYFLSSDGYSFTFADIK